MVEIKLSKDSTCRITGSVPYNSSYIAKIKNIKDNALKFYFYVQYICILPKALSLDKNKIVF